MGNGIFGGVITVAGVSFTKPMITRNLPGVGMTLRDSLESHAAAFTSVTVPTYPTRPGSIPESFFTDFYFKIWVIPDTLRVTNPRLFNNIPFKIWNAFPFPNTLDTIGSTGAAGVVLDISAGQLFKEVELRTVNVQVTSGAPTAVDALFTFDFTSGLGTFRFITRSLGVSEDVPEYPVEEIWEFLTDVFISQDGGEQRVSLRDIPRRFANQTVRYNNVADIRKVLASMFSGAAKSIYIPYYQFSTLLTAPVTVGGDELFFDPQRTDIRAGDFALVRGPGLTSLVEIASLTATGAITVDPLDASYAKGATVVPARNSASLTGTAASRYAVVDGLDFAYQTQALDPVGPIIRPGTLVGPVTLDALMVLDARPRGDKFPESYVTDQTIVDYETGPVELRSLWLHPQIGYSRTFKIDRLVDVTNFDWWRVFLSGANGMQHPFLMPTFRPDFVIVASSGPSGTSVTLAGSEYFDTYYWIDAFKYLAFYDGGVASPTAHHYTKIVAAVVNGAGNTVLTIGTQFPAIGNWNATTDISMLLKCRLASDTVKFTHGLQSTQLDLSFQTADA